MPEGSAIDKTAGLLRVGRHAQLVLLLALAIAPLAGCVHRPPLQPYEGSWLLNGAREGHPGEPSKPVMALTLKKVHGHLHGVLIRPELFHEDEHGAFDVTGTHVVQVRITGPRFDHPLLDLQAAGTLGNDYLPIALIDPDHLILVGFPGLVPPWRFQKVPVEPQLNLEQDWPKPPSDTQ